MSNKILVGIFIVLLMLFSAEVGVILSGNLTKNSTAVTPTPEIAIKNTSPIDNGKQAISQDTIDSFGNLNVFKKGVLKLSTIRHVLEGKITKITTPSQLTGNAAEMANFTIVGTEELSNSFFFPPSEISDMKVFQGADKTPTTLESLKVGDIITLEFEIEVYDASSDVEKGRLITITKKL